MWMGHIAGIQRSLEFPHLDMDMNKNRILRKDVNLQGHHEYNSKPDIRPREAQCYEVSEDSKCYDHIAIFTDLINKLW